MLDPAKYAVAAVVLNHVFVHDHKAGALIAGGIGVFVLDRYLAAVGALIVAGYPFRIGIGYFAEALQVLLAGRAFAGDLAAAAFTGMDDLAPGAVAALVFDEELLDNPELTTIFTFYRLALELYIYRTPAIISIGLFNFPHGFFY